MTIRTNSWVAVALAVALAATPSLAQDDPNDAAYSRANQLRSAQHFEEALAIYQGLHAQTSAPRALAQVGVTEAQMGRWVPAETHLLAALGAHDPWIERNRAVLQAALERTQQNLGDLTVACNVGGASLRVGGTPVGALPRTVRVPIGPMVVDVLADGYEPHRQTVVTTARETRIEVTLVSRVAPVAVAVVPAPAPAPTATPVPTVGAAVRVPVTPVRPVAPRPSGDGTMRTLAWVSAGGGVALLATGVVAYTVGANAATRWNDDAQCQRSGMTREQVCAGERSTAETMSALAVTGFVTGGVLAATSAVLFVLSRGQGHAQGTARASLACGQGPGELGIACGGRF